ncbi:hypothetical protein ACIRJL_17235 [Streptomyces sp. NPDC102383]|uniref:hypothetical protein n=1 Tax=Streptomyces sp. NPDC102383 TaxID=3366165 RepID=UPI00382BA95D
MKDSSEWRLLCAPGGWVRVFRPADQVVVYMRLRETSNTPTGRLNVHTVVMDHEDPISTHVWRYVPFQAVEDTINSTLTDPLWEGVLDDFREQLDSEPIQVGKLESLFGTPEEIASLDSPDPVITRTMFVLGDSQDPGEEPPPLTRPAGRITDDFLSDLARSYRWLVASGESAPASVISKQTGAPVATVRRWLVNARQRGMLPPGRRGRAG